MKCRFILILTFFLKPHLTFAEAILQNQLMQSELHWSLCGNSAKEIIRKLDLEADKKEERFVTFYDLKNPDGSYHLFSRGIVLRLRLNALNQASSTVKIKVNNTENFFEPENLSKEEKYKCEEDRYLKKTSSICSLSRDFEFKKQEIFSESQKTFLKKAYVYDLNLDKLSRFGPVLNSSWVFSRSKGFVLEEMRLPDSSSFYELSLRVPMNEAEHSYRENLAFLQKKNIHLCDVQESKTLKILNFFKTLKNLKE